MLRVQGRLLGKILDKITFQIELSIILAFYSLLSKFLPFFNIKSQGFSQCQSYILFPIMHACAHIILNYYNKPSLLVLKHGRHLFLILYFATKLFLPLTVIFIPWTHHLSTHNTNYSQPQPSQNVFE